MEILFGFLSLAMGAVCVFLPLIAIIRRLDSQSWRLVQAKVIQSDVNVDKWEGRRAHTDYTHQLIIEYEVDGIKYTYEPSWKTIYSNERMVIESCKKYPVGSTVWVRVNWKNPKHVVIEGYESLWTFLSIMLLGAVLMVTGLFWVGWLDWNSFKKIFSP